MGEVFRIEMLPARQGDCILIEYGNAAAPHRVLVDGGPVQAFSTLESRIAKIPAGQRTFELVVVTHIDSDHIGGIVPLLHRKALGVTCLDLWFNGWPQLRAGLADMPYERAARQCRGVEQAVFLELRMHDVPWNEHFQGGAIFVPWTGQLPEIELQGGLKLTLLSPNIEKLRLLRNKWSGWFQKKNHDLEERATFEVKLAKMRAYRGASDEQVAEEASAIPLKLDAAVANGSSIAFIAEYAGKSCALLGDAHLPIIESALKRLLIDRHASEIRLDAIKLSHHGSSANLTRSFLELVRCRRFLVSTDGSIFNHPDDSAIRRLLSHVEGCHLYFNYRSAQNEKWAEPVIQRKRRYAATYPDAGEQGVSVDLLQT